MAPRGVAAREDAYPEPCIDVWCAHDACGKRIERPRMRQRFCSGSCRAAWYDKNHPRIAVPGLGNRSVPIKERIIAEMADGFWRTTAALAYALRESEGTVSRKLRMLKAEGYKVEKRATGGSRAPREYRLSNAGLAST